MRIFQIITLVIALASTQSTNAQGTIPTVGKEFWMGYMNNYGTFAGVVELRLFISGQNATTGNVEIPLQGWSQTFAVVPGVVTTVTIPTALAHHILNDVVDTRGVHITTADTVSVFAINFHDYTADASKVLPIRSLGTEYIVTTYGGIGSGFDLSSEFLIVATEDNTEIEITPSVATSGGFAAGSTYTIQLDQGETYQVKSATSSTDLSGTFIKATAASGSCRPFAVFAGSQCTNIPTNCSACDHIYDQLLPSASWGSEYYIAPFAGTTGYTYQIMARENGTQISINGAAPFNLNSGQYVFYNDVPGGMQVIGSQPIAVTQFMQGVTCSGAGDPAMLVLNANDQKIEEVTFSTVTSTVITDHSLNVIVETADIGTVLLDNVAIPAASFTAFAANPLNSYASVPITQGSHNLQAPNGFSGYVYGTGSAESYAYSVGSFRPEPPLLIDSALCTNDTVFLSPPISLFSPEWTTLSDTATVIATTNTLVLIPPIINDVYIITGNSLVSGCVFEYLFSVAVPNPPVIDAIASDDTVCLFENIQMDVNVTTPGLFAYEWTPGYYFDQPTAQNPVLTALVSGWYYVTVSSIGSTCSSATDSVYIHINGGTIGKLDLTTTDPQICLGDSSQHNVDVYQVAHFDDFNGGNDPNLWNNIAGFTNSNICGSITGDALFFDGGAPRVAETVDMNTSLGGTIDFSIKIADGTAPCDNADPGENVLLQYSNNGGGAWTTISTLFENAYPNFVAVSATIPVAAQTAATRFRWIQPVFTAAAQDVWMLENVSFQLLDNTGFTFTWTPPNTLNNPSSLTPFATPIVDTWYVLDVVQGQCTYTDSILVSVSDFTVDAGPDTILCLTTGYQMIASTTATTPTYTWNHPTVLNNTAIVNPIIQNDTTLTYALSVSNGVCSIVDSVTVTYVSGSTSGLISDTTICFGESVLIDMTGNANIVWTPTTNIANPTSTSPIFSPTADQLYYVSYLTPQGCVLTDSVQFYVDDLPVVSISNDTLICLGESVVISSTINAVPNPVYSWSTTAATPTITASAAGTYILTLTTVCGVDRDTMVLATSAPVMTLPEFFSLCDASEVEVTAYVENAVNYVWEGGLTGPTVSLGEGVHTVTAYGVCEVTDSVEVVVGVVDFTLGQDRHMCHDEEVFLAPQINDLDSILWSNGSTSYIYSYEEPFTFGDTLEIWATAFGCGDVTDTVYLFVDDCNCPFFIPNTFTPNGDEYNHSLRMSHDCLFESFELRIFNRWGELIFQSFDPDFEWDGSYNGSMVSDGTYIWQAVYKYSYDIERTDVYTKTGHIAVLR